MRVLRWIVIVALLGALIWGASVGWAAYNLYTLVNATAAIDLSQQTPSQLAQTVSDLSRAGGRTTGQVQWLVPVVGAVGGDACVGARLTALADVLTDIGEGNAPLIEVAFDALNSGLGTQISIAGLRDGWAAQDHESIANRLRQISPPTECEGASPRLAYYAEAAEGLRFVLLAVYEAPLEQLIADGTSGIIVLNNSDELRATGGFTTAYGYYAINDGVLSWEFGNSYDIDRYFIQAGGVVSRYRQLPFAYSDFMGLTRWLFRDANWSPDYPTTAEDTINIFSQDTQREEPDTVITVNFTAIETLARFTPNLTVGGTPFTPDNAVQRLRDTWSEGVVQQSDETGRKNFIQDFAVELVRSLQTQLGPADLSRLGLAVEAMLERRDIIAYSRQPELGAFLAERGWDGSMLAVEGDYLMVVDTNIGYNKASARVTRAIDYRVDLTGDVPVADLAITINNTNTENFTCTLIDSIPPVEEQTAPPVYEDRMLACYWNYARFFTVLDAKMQSYSVFEFPAEWAIVTKVGRRARIDIMQEADHIGWGTMLVVPTTESRTIEYSYNLPETILSTSRNCTTYTLTLQRQPGTNNTDVSVTLTLPEGASVNGFEVTGGVTANVGENQVILTGELERSDITADVTYCP